MKKFFDHDRHQRPEMHISQERKGSGCHGN
jgi:hypothetical protein